LVSGYAANWSEEVFKVRDVLSTHPITYLLSDLNGENIEGAFYAEELSLADDFQGEITEVDSSTSTTSDKGIIH